MYNSGDLKVAQPPCSSIDEDGYCDEYDHKHRLTDARQKGNDTYGPGTAYLEHSCQEWVIGGPEQIRSMINELEAALKQLETPSSLSISAHR